MKLLPFEFQKQKVMRTVTFSLMPALVGAIYFFGWISLGIVLISIVSCVITEWLFVRGKNGKVSEAVFVTAVLYGLTLPPTLPLYMVVLGAVFGITFGKMAFGGFGNNIFNPALVGRGFVYITFPVHMTNRWMPAADFSSFPGGFAAWRYTSAEDALATFTSATPLSAFRDGATSLPGYLQLFFGNIFGQFEKLGELTHIGGGSLGETSAFLIILGGGYIIYKKAANWRLVVSFFTGFLATQTVLFLMMPDKVADPLFALLAGGVIFAGFFMITDPISATRTDVGRWIYGIMAGMLTVFIRSFSLFAGGVMFAILLANMFGPIIDYAVTSVKKSTSTQ